MEHLLVLLEDLRKRLTTYNGTESSPCESYCFFVERSSSGDNCQYAKKTVRLFEKRDYPEIRDMISCIYKHLQEIENNAGK